MSEISLTGYQQYLDFGFGFIVISLTFTAVCTFLLAVLHISFWRLFSASSWRYGYLAV